MTREDGTRVPGDRRHANRLRAAREGVAVDEALPETLRDLTGGGDLGALRAAS